MKINGITFDERQLLILDGDFNPYTNATLFAEVVLQKIGNTYKVVKVRNPEKTGLKNGETYTHEQLFGPPKSERSKRLLT